MLLDQQHSRLVVSLVYDLIILATSYIHIAFLYKCCALTNVYKFPAHSHDLLLHFIVLVR